MFSLQSSQSPSPSPDFSLFRSPAPNPRGAAALAQQLSLRSRTDGSSAQHLSSARPLFPRPLIASPCSLTEQYASKKRLLFSHLYKHKNVQLLYCDRFTNAWGRGFLLQANVPYRSSSNLATRPSSLATIPCAIIFLREERGLHLSPHEPQSSTGRVSLSRYFFTSLLRLPPMEQMRRSHVFTGAEVIGMHKFTMWLAAAILMTGILTTRVSRSADDGPIVGDWSAKIMSGCETACIDLEVQRSSWGHHNTWGNTHKLTDFVGLDASLANAKDSAVHFELRRDAGIMSFDGRFHSGEGSGKFSFAASAEYVQGMKALGYSSLDQEQIFAFAIHDVSRQFVKDMGDVGYRNLSTDELMAFRIHGVSPEFARAMIELLPEKPSPDNLVAMRIHGVSPEFTKEINALLGKRFSVDELVAFRIHGVSPEFVREVRESVSKDVSADDLVAMRIHGASPEFVKSMTALMGHNLPVEQLVAFRIHGVSPEFTEEIQKLVEKNISSDDLVAFRIHGVSPEFVRSMKEAGYANISPDQLVAMRIHGVDASFVKEVREHGYKDPSIDDLIELRIHGLRNRESL